MTEINAGKGALGKIAKDPAFAQKLDDTVTRLDSILKGVDEGKGTVGQLVQNRVALRSRGPGPGPDAATGEEHSRRPEEVPGDPAEAVLRQDRSFVSPERFRARPAYCSLGGLACSPMPVSPSRRCAWLRCFLPVPLHSTHKAVLAASTWCPAYTKSGEMLPPGDYREWIFLTSGIDMSYSPKAAGMPGPLDVRQCFVNPEAYRSFLETGTWPDKTVMVLEGREAASKGSINQRGHFQSGEVMGLKSMSRMKRGFRASGRFSRSIRRVEMER